MKNEPWRGSAGLRVKHLEKKLGAQKKNPSELESLNRVLKGAIWDYEKKLADERAKVAKLLDGLREIERQTDHTTMNTTDSDCEPIAHYTAKTLLAEVEAKQC